MPVYIVCRKKRNNPRMDVRICELKCAFKDECEEFKAQCSSVSTPSLNASGESVGEGLKAA
ncbi:MAG: hypothetical protein JXL84_10245 [Deltaproteobacteria bacterium]|nr:hypothetical protein [Deltaproteobacteria bacterium]